MYNKRDVNNLYDYVNVCYSYSSPYTYSPYDNPYDDVNDNDGYTYSRSSSYDDDDNDDGYYDSNNDYDSSSYSCYDDDSRSHVSYRYDDDDSSIDHCCYDDGDDCIDSFINFYVFIILIRKVRKIVGHI